MAPRKDGEWMGAMRGREEYGWPALDERVVAVPHAARAQWCKANGSVHVGWVEDLTQLGADQVKGHTVCMSASYLCQSSTTAAGGVITVEWGRDPIASLPRMRLVSNRWWHHG